MVQQSRDRPPKAPLITGWSISGDSLYCFLGCTQAKMLCSYLKLLELHALIEIGLAALFREALIPSLSKYM